MATYVYYMPYKLILGVVNVTSCYWSLYKYGQYFARRHLKVVEDEEAVGVVLKLEEADPMKRRMSEMTDGRRSERRMTVTALTARLSSDASPGAVPTIHVSELDIPEFPTLTPFSRERIGTGVSSLGGSQRGLGTIAEDDAVVEDDAAAADEAVAADKAIAADEDVAEDETVADDEAVAEGEASAEDVGMVEVEPMATKASQSFQDEMERIQKAMEEAEKRRANMAREMKKIRKAVEAEKSKTEMARSMV